MFIVSVRNNGQTAVAVNIDRESDSQKLFFKDFVIKLLWHFINKTDSLPQLSLELKTDDSCKELPLLYPIFQAKKWFFKSIYFMRNCFYLMFI